MLSTEFPPPDPVCCCEFSHLKSCCSKISDGERDPVINQLQLEVDLFKALPKFSIRDYVSSKRGKYIRTNWPFSQKNLQLCLHHGVPDVLPPFQSLDTVRNPSRSNCAGENTTTDDAGDHFLSASSNNDGDQNLAVCLENISSIGSKEDKELPLSKRCDNSDTDCGQLIANHLEPERVNLPSFFVEKSKSSVVALEKLEKNIQSSETMASKVCPVCKTFSSSSNTTLNVHIDQCLSGGSMMEWTSSSKVSKHRIKPRKIKFIVDVYATALRCTLEDLDRRNGTKWAANLGLPSQDFEQRAEDKKIKSADNVNGNNKEGAEYVDSNGTKFLSLSKFSSFRPNYNHKKYFRSSKLVREKKRRKFHSSNSNKILVRKHKILKYPHNGQLCCSARSYHLPEDNHHQRRNRFRKVYEDEYITQPVVKVCDQKKSDVLRMKNLQVVSWRTGHEKINFVCEKPLQNKIVKNLKVKGNLSARGDWCIKNRSDSNSPVFSDESPPPLPFEHHKMKEKSWHNIECGKQSSMRKRTGLPSLASQDYRHTRIRSALSYCKAKQSRKDYPSIYENHTDPLNNMESCDLFHRNRRTVVDTDPAFDAADDLSDSRIYHLRSVSSADKDLTTSPTLDCLPSPGDKTLSFTGKRLSVTNASFPKLDKKPRIHYSCESDEEAVVPRSELCRQHIQVEKLVANKVHIGEPPTKRGVVLKLRHKKVEFDNSSKEGSMTSKGSETSSESYSCFGIRKNIDSCIGSGISENTSNVLGAVKDIEIGNDFVLKQISQMADGETFTTFSQSLDSAFHGLTGSSDIECNSKHRIKAFDKHYRTELLLGGESEMFCEYKIVKNVLTPETREVAELDTDNQQGNYFVDVDPIAIPGPPGSFLPSPGRMSSEELQGNSSLTTCRIQSSEDIDSSMVSESADARSGLRPVVYLSEHLCNTYEDRIDHVVQSFCPFVQTGCAETKLNLDRLRYSVKQREVNLLRLKNGLPCCCSWKEGPIQSKLLSYHKSLQQTNTSLQHSQEKSQTDCIPNKEAYYFNLRPEPTPMPEKENSPIWCAPSLVSHNSETKFSTCVEGETSRTTNAVLRLMGKNLMVLNKDENSSPQTRHAQLQTVDDHPKLLSNVHHGDSAVRFPHEHDFAHHYLSQARPKFDCVKPTVLRKQLVTNPSNGFETTSPVTVQGLPSNSALTNHLDGSFTSYLGPHQFVGGCNLTAESGSGCGIEKLKLLDPFSSLFIRTAELSSCKHKEVIAVNDCMESEARLVMSTISGESISDIRGSTEWIPASMAIGLDSRHTNPYFSNQAWADYHLYNQFSTAFLKGNEHRQTHLNGTAL